MNNIILLSVFFFFKQKTAYEMRISDWSSDVCSSDLSAGWVKRMWRHRAVNIRNGARIGVHTTGLPSGEPILLLSSLLADWRSWNEVAGRLPSGVYAITIDLRGDGTWLPTAGDYSLADLVADEPTVMDNLAFEILQIV